MNAVRAIIDRAGRLVIPKQIRQKGGLRPGVPVIVRWRGGRIEIEPAPAPVRLIRRGKLLVAVPRKRVGVLAADTVERTRKTLRRERHARA